MRFRPDIWLLGLPLVAGAAALGIWLEAPAIETRLRRAIQADHVRSAGTELGRAGARVEVEGRELSVTAHGPLAPSARAEADRLVAAIAGLRGPVYRLLPPASVQPFTFSARHSGRGLVLAGHVPPGGIRAELLDEAAEGTAAVRDDLRSALGAPEGFEEAARLAVRAARRLDRAAVSLTDRSLSITGDARDAQSFREVTSLLRTPPSGYTARIEINPPIIRPYTWSATRERDSLVLAGHVPSEAERRVILAFAREASPGTGIEDRMDVARGLESGVDFDTVAKRVLAIIGRLESGRAELSGRDLSVEGKLAARDLIDQLGRELKSARLPGVELQRAELTPVVPRPYRMVARRKDGRLLLTGYLPADPDRAALREAVQKRFPFDAVVDDLHLADGAPDSMLASARSGLDHLALLSQGELVIEDRRMRLSGASLYPERGKRTQSAFASVAPPGWTATAEVSITPDKPLDAGFCGDLVADVVGREPLRFEAGQADLTAPARKVLARIADVMRRCGSAQFKVVSIVEVAGEEASARELAAKRAAGLAAALGELGVSAIPQAEVPSAGSGSKGSERITFEVQP